MRVEMVVATSANPYPNEAHACTRAEAMRLMPWAKIVKKVNNGWLGFDCLSLYRDWARSYPFA